MAYDNMYGQHTKAVPDGIFSRRVPDLDMKVTFPDKSWELACFIGMCRSELLYGYPDSFDGVDYMDYAADMYREDYAGPLPDITVGELLTQYAKDAGDAAFAKALKELAA